MWKYRNSDELYHYGVKGMKWRNHIYKTPIRGTGIIRRRTDGSYNPYSNYGQATGSSRSSSGIKTSRKTTSQVISNIIGQSRSSNAIPTTKANKDQARAIIKEAKFRYKSAKKEYSKAFDKAYNYSASHIISQYGRNKKTADANWNYAYNKATEVNKAKADYRKIKKRYK